MLRGRRIWSETPTPLTPDQRLVEWIPGVTGLATWQKHVPHSFTHHSVLFYNPPNRLHICFSSLALLIVGERSRQEAGLALRPCSHPVCGSSTAHSSPNLGAITVLSNCQLVQLQTPKGTCRMQKPGCGWYRAQNHARHREDHSTAPRQKGRDQDWDIFLRCQVYILYQLLNWFHSLCLVILNWFFLLSYWTWVKRSLWVTFQIYTRTRKALDDQDSPEATMLINTAAICRMAPRWGLFLWPLATLGWPE